jgi:para-nitrobenzyl esterase
VDGERAARALHVFGAAVGGAPAYRAAYPDADAEQLYERVKSDWLCRMATVRLLDAQAGTGSGPVRLRTALARPRVRRSARHLSRPRRTAGVRQPGRSLARQMLGERPPEEAVALSVRMRTAWTEVPRTGDPGWPA